MKKKIFTTTAFFVILFFVYTVTLWAAVARQPITVNGDTVEYKTEGGEMVAQGNVEIIQLDSKLTCDKVRVFMDAKIAIAEGHVKFLKTDGQELHGDMIVYDFDEQTGTIVRPQIKMVPYYGKAQVMEKISDSEFLMNGSEISTCDLPHPHYKLTCDEVHMYPGRLMTAKGVKFLITGAETMLKPDACCRAMKYVLSEMDIREHSVGGRA